MIPLPQIERTNVFKGEFSPTGLGTADCLRRFYFDKLLKIRDRKTATPLIFGSCIHSAVEYIYGNHLTQSKQELEMNAVKEFVKGWSIAGDKKRNVQTGMIAIRNYVNTYYEDLQLFKQADIEASQWMPMDNGTKLLAKIDRVLINDYMIRFVDTKTTTSALTDYYFKKYENDAQMSLYFMVVERLFGRCDEFQIDGIYLPPTGDMEKDFGRRSFRRTELQISDAVDSYTQKTNYIMNVLNQPEDTWARSFYCNTSECDKYGGCKYLPLCVNGFDYPAFDIEYVVGDEMPESKKLTMKSKGRIV